MKLDKLEKMILTIFLLFLLFFATTIYSGLQEIEKAGGWSEVFISIGKEIKHINDEIDKD